MRALRYGIAAAAICSGILVVPAGAQQAATPMALPPQQPTERRGVPAPPGSQHGSWDRMGMRGFSVALVVGDLTGASTADNLPAGAKKALSDMRDFLPYKSYRLLDTHWILCCSSAHSSVAGRLRGSEEDEYSFQIYARPTNESSELSITFSLRDVGVSTAEQAVTNVISANQRLRRLSELMRERDDLQRRHDEVMQKVGDRHPDRMKLRADLENKTRQIQELERGAMSRSTNTRSSTRPVLDSAFNMKVGETVVIGASSIKGQKALIALLTAASRNSTAAR